jgi:autotransporter translocation and assembly factor TamB
VGEEGESTIQPRRSRSWIRWLLIGLGTIFLVLAVFHGPILRSVGRAVAVKVAAGQNLKIDFQLEGDPLDQVILRNVHATATGPSAVQSLEAGTVKVEYSLPDLIFHGMADALKNVEVHDLSAVLDPSKAAIPKPTPPPKNATISLPPFFPDRLEATNVNLTIRQKPEDMVIKNLNLELYQKQEGKLRIDKVQIPGVHTWTNISATTTYAGKNLYLRNLTLDEENKLEMVNVDASAIGQGKLGVEFKGVLGGGQVESKIDLSTKGSTYQTRTNVHAKDISLAKLGQYLGKSPVEFSGDVKTAAIDLQGSLDRPLSWDGTINAEVRNLRQGNFGLDEVKLEMTAADGKATVQEARIDAGTNHIVLRGSIDLPATAKDFGRTPGNFQISIDAPDLKQLTGFLTPPATGSLQASGNLKIENETIHLDLTANGDLVGFDHAAVKKLSATISAAKKMPSRQKEGAPFYENLTSTVKVTLSDLRYGDFAIDQVIADLKSDGPTVSLSSFSATRKDNVLLAGGNYQLPPPGSTESRLTGQPTDLQFTLRAPQLADYWRSEAPNKVTGEMEADGNVRIRGGVANGQINLSGQQIAAQKLVVKQLSMQTAIANNIAYLNDLTATLNEKDYVNAHGTLKLEKPFVYTGTATANLADLSAFEPLLAAGRAGEPGSAARATDEEGKKTPLAGSLVLNWKGRGEAATLKNNGDLELKLEKGRYGDLQDLQAKVEARYTPQELQVPIIYLASNKLIFQAILQAKDSILEISKIQIDQGTAKYASAYASIPFTWSNLGSETPLFPPNGKVAIHLQTENLDLAKLFKDLGKEPPVAGQLSVKMDAEGPLDQLVANLDLQLQSLRTDAVKQLEPATVNFGLRLQNNELKVAGKVQQPRIQPVQIDAQLPLNLSRLIAEKKLDEQTPVNGKIQMPRSSINFVRQFVPALNQLDGALALNVNLGGTVARPDLSGSADMSINLARFENATLPALTNFKALLNFRQNRLAFDRFGGDLAGGPFTLSGSIDLPKLTEPKLDLRLKANSVLVARNDDLTARVDADIKVEGPLAGATVSGQVLTTNSRFLKNIDIIPITLPGRPAPLPEPPSTTATLSFPDPPLRDWKFDIVIKSKDPFLIRGNLATGSAIVDMKLTGTGLHPQLQGQVRLENFDATLPFSTLTIGLGFLYFDPDDPLNPKIELQGESLIQDYTIRVFVYGTAHAPQAIFSSEPPLPQEDIISLLATGVTRENLSGGNVLASRALLLLGKELYRKIFKKGADESPKTDSIFNRLSVDYSGADPRTGEQTATAKYKASEHVILIGEIGLAGDFRGLVKYVIRFR